MIKYKDYTKLFKKDKVEVLPFLTSFESGMVTNLEKSMKENRQKNKSGGRVEIMTNLCKGCLLCIEACPPEVLIESDSLNKMGYHAAEYVSEGCTGCGICFYICPEPGVITVYKRVKTN